VFDIVYESPDKDGFSTSGWSRDYTGKWMDPRHEMIGAAAPEQQPYSQSNEEEPYYILKTNNPYTFYVPDGYYPDHFMPWVHPFVLSLWGSYSVL
jgi:hypothetical protein